jgi:hypothetical protein
MSGIGKPETACLGGMSPAPDPEHFAEIRRAIENSHDLVRFATDEKNQSVKMDGNDASQLAEVARTNIDALEAELREAGIEP